MDWTMIPDQQRGGKPRQWIMNQNGHGSGKDGLSRKGSLAKAKLGGEGAPSYEGTSRKNKKGSAMGMPGILWRAIGEC